MVEGVTCIFIYLFYHKTHVLFDDQIHIREEWRRRRRRRRKKTIDPS